MASTRHLRFERVGLRRAGFTAEQRLELKKLYHCFFAAEKSARALAEARKNFSSAPAKILLDFVAGAKRGVCSDIGRAPE
jgi:acyl-[acyl carrier protein]--UDP-N-acetylglucosamine O-acyltransferase